MGNAAISSHRLPLLDGLRGIAAIAVMLYHAGNSFGGFGLFSRGYLFVDFFFLLSGFVLTLAAEERMASGRLGPRAFLWSRIVRLWPTIAVGVLFGAVSLAISGNVRGLPVLVVMGLLMIPATSGARQIFPLNGPQWSLLLELLANVAHALILRRLANRWLVAFIAVAALALWWTTSAYGSNTLGPDSANWWLALPRVAFSYSLGIWLARNWTATPHRPLVSWRTALLLPVAAVTALVVLPIGPVVGDLTIIYLVFPVLFWLALTAGPPPEARIWLDRLGALSFPLYAVHLPILETFERLSHARATAGSAVGTALIAAWLVGLALRSSGMRFSGLFRPKRQSLPT